MICITCKQDVHPDFFAPRSWVCDECKDAADDRGYVYALSDNVRPLQGRVADQLAYVLKQTNATFRR